jgi:hypothetical protein
MLTGPACGHRGLTDTGNEIDDQYALALALGEPGRLHLEGIVAANFGEPGGVAGINN